MGIMDFNFYAQFAHVKTGDISILRDTCTCIYFEQKHQTQPMYFIPIVVNMLFKNVIFFKQGKFISISIYAWQIGFTT